MTKKLFTLLLASFLALSGSAQVVFFINAGSRAGHGQVQEILIDKSGNGSYRLREQNAGVKDSALFTLGPSQMDSLFREAEQNGFFSLNNKYDGGAADGAGIYISLNASGRSHAVELLNTDQPPVNRLVTLLNRMLTPRNIRINYGQFIIPRQR